MSFKQIRNIKELPEDWSVPKDGILDLCDSKRRVILDENCVDESMWFYHYRDNLYINQKFERLLVIEPWYGELGIDEPKWYVAFAEDAEYDETSGDIFIRSASSHEVKAIIPLHDLINILAYEHTGKRKEFIYPLTLEDIDELSGNILEKLREDIKEDSDEHDLWYSVIHNMIRSKGNKE